MKSILAAAALAALPSFAPGPQVPNASAPAVAARPFPFRGDGPLGARAERLVPDRAALAALEGLDAVRVTGASLPTRGRAETVDLLLTRYRFVRADALLSVAA